jgi:hypothetical protein
MTQKKPHFVLTCGKMPKRYAGQHIEAMFRNKQIGEYVEDKFPVYWERRNWAYDIIAVRFLP